MALCRQAVAGLAGQRVPEELVVALVEAHSALDLGGRCMVWFETGTMRDAIQKAFGDQLRSVGGIQGTLRAVLTEYEVDPGSEETWVYAVFRSDRFLAARTRAFIDFVGDVFSGPES